jgi:hypothetical protein
MRTDFQHLLIQEDNGVLTITIAGEKRHAHYKGR